MGTLGRHSVEEEAQNRSQKQQSEQEVHQLEQAPAAKTSMSKVGKSSLVARF